MKHLFIFLICGFSYGQVLPEKCELRLANDQWIEKFEKASSKSEKIDLIKDKIKSDSIFKENNDPDLYCDYKAQFLLHHSKRKHLSLYLNNDRNQRELLQKIDAINIKEIELITFPYWKRGLSCGDSETLPRLILLSLETDSKELKKEIKKILQQLNKS